MSTSPISPAYSALAGGQAPIQPPMADPGAAQAGAPPASVQPPPAPTPQGGMPDVTNPQVTQPVQANPAPPPSAPVNAHRSLAASIIGAIADTLGGKTHTDLRTNSDGTQTQVQNPNSRTQQIGNIVANALRGGAAGASQRNLAQGALVGGEAAIQGQQSDQQNRLLQQASVSKYNNENLMARRKLANSETEQRQTMLDSQNKMRTDLKDAGAQDMSILVDGKDINGTPGNSEAMMKYFSDNPQALQAPEGYSLMHTYSQDADGKPIDTVHQVPVDALKTMVDPSAEVKKTYGIPDGTKLSLGQNVTLQGNIMASQAKAKAEQDKMDIAKANNETKLAAAKVRASNLSSDPGTQRVISQMLMEGRLSVDQMPKGKNAGTFYAQLAAADKLNREQNGQGLNPVQSSVDFKTIGKVNKDYSPGGDVGKNIVAFNTAASHIALLDDAVTALDNNNFPAANAILNKFGRAVGDPRTITYDVIKNAAKGELTKTFSGSNAAQAEKDEIGQPFDNANSSEALHGATRTAGSLMLSKSETLRQGYSVATGKDSPERIYYPEGVAAYKKLGIQLPSGVGPKASKTTADPLGIR